MDRPRPMKSEAGMKCQSSRCQYGSFMNLSHKCRNGCANQVPIEDGKMDDMNDKEKFVELLKDFDSREIEASSVGDWEENIPRDLYSKHFLNNKYKKIEDIDAENDKWCSIVTTVVEIYGKYFGMTHVDAIHNNNTDISDCLKLIEVFEVKQSTKKTFKKK